MLSRFELGRPTGSSPCSRRTRDGSRPSPRACGGRRAAWAAAWSRSRSWISPGARPHLRRRHPGQRPDAWLALRDRLETTATAWYFAESVERSTEERAPAPRLYDLLVHGFELLDRGLVPARRGRWFEFRMLDELGLAPRLPLRRVRPAPGAWRTLPLGSRLGRPAVRAHPGPPAEVAGLSPRTPCASSRPTAAAMSRRSPRSPCPPPWRPRREFRPPPLRSTGPGARSPLAGVPRRGARAGLSADVRSRTCGRDVRSRMCGRRVHAGCS